VVGWRVKVGGGRREGINPSWGGRIVQETEMVNGEVARSNIDELRE